MLSETQLDDLSNEQKSVVKAVLSGHNVFLTGPPGSGKSFVLKRIIQVLKDSEQDVTVCASTGVAAIHVNGCTFHSFLGCGHGSEEQWKKAKVAKSKKQVRRRLRRTHVLILDEISMLSGDFLDRASELLSHVRKQEDPFGGLQVVLCGDFLQLPPVKAETLAFQASVWSKLQLQFFSLRSNFRQAEDAKFKDFLQQLRVGKLSLNSLQEILQEHEEGDVSYPKIVSTNKEVEAINLERLSQLPGEELIFRAEDRMEPKAPSVEKALENLMAPEELRLKVGCWVMLLVNLRQPEQCKSLSTFPPRDARERTLPPKRPPLEDLTFGNLAPEAYKGLQIPLVNGSMGQVVDFEDGFPVVQFARGYRRQIQHHLFEGELGHLGKYSRLQLPLKVAWAMTIHKTQGLTLESGELDLSKVFDPAQLYVALSRFRSLTGVNVTGLPSRLPTPNEMTRRAMDFHKNLEAVE